MLNRAVPKVTTGPRTGPKNEECARYL